jgi:acetolactate synthase-1/2/3 large subunit
MKASELIIQCLEQEGVRYIFGLPGEENIALLDALTSSGIQFVLTRDERGASFMANALGRFTGRPGVCLSTLGPGATNLATGIADAFLDFAPMVAITAQTSRQDLHKESHQYIDIPSMFKPLTKWNTRIEGTEEIPEILRKAFKIAMTEKPGPVHLELPEDVAEFPAEGHPITPSAISYPTPSDKALSQAAALIKKSKQPIIIAGNGVIRGNASKALKAFSEKLRIPVATTFMGMGAVPADYPLFISTVGLQARDYISCGIDRADLIIAVGYDPVEFSPKHWSHGKDIIHINFTMADVDEHYPSLEVIGDIQESLQALTESSGREKDPSYFVKLRGLAEQTMGCSPDGFPLKPVRIVHEIRNALGREDILISDVGAHKIWIARFYPAFQGNTVIISNGLAAMGCAIPAAISAKLLFPHKKVIAAVGDGGFLMSLPEIETAVRLGTAFICLVFNDSAFGLIQWKEQLKYKRDFFVRFKNPDFPKLADSFGAKGYRVSSEDELEPILSDALVQNVPAIIDCPVDYAENILLSEKLGKLICPM